MSNYAAEQIVSTEGFMPHGMCYLWQPAILGLHVISDGLIALAYLSIPFTLFYFVRKHADRQFDWILVCFAIFIIACGFTHLMEIWTIWHPAYWLSGGVKVITALASVTTAILLIRVVPLTLRLPSPSALRRVNLDLEHQIDERIRAEAALRQANESLERRVADRTAQLEAVNQNLAQDNERFAVAADAAGLAFWSFDIAANMLQWDDRMFQLYGVSRMDGEQPYALWAGSLHAEDKARCEQELSDALNGLRPFDTDFRIVHPNRAVRYLRAAARITRDADGRAVRMFGVNFEITERKRADEQFRLAIDAAPTGMLLMNADGIIVLANAQIESLFGYPRSELLGQRIEKLVPERFRVHHPEFREGFFGAPNARPMGAGRDLYGLRKNGSEVPIEIGLNPLQTSQGMFVLSSIIDLSQRREMERLRTDFVSTVSHELRTPLTSIAGSLGLLQSGALGALPDKAADMIEIAYKNSGRLVRIINDILDIGRLEAGQLALQMTSVPLGELLQQSVEANISYAEKYGVRFVLDTGAGDERVLADPDRLMQVITNLLSNAAKFSPSGADVHIRVRSGSTMIRVEVEDSGAGIPESFRSRIFEKFAQGDASAARRFEGTGLGLSIARKLMEAMGGNIGFSSVAGHGTIFNIELPRLDIAAAVDGMMASVPRILYVVDDDEHLLNEIREILAGRAELVQARGMHEAERRLRDESYELVILNQSLPDPRLVKRIPALVGHSVPIVLLAAESPNDVRGMVTAVLVKSQVSAAEVVTTIFSHIPLSQT
jgi:PAS domain S-box-containing protein